MLHNVYFWLKADTSPSDRLYFEAELKRLLLIDEIEWGMTGRPAPTAERPQTDHSFDYSLHLRFKSRELHDHYQSEAHAAHQRFITECRPFFDQVKVYDSESL
jgi:hypothetical protein